jgi:hypothetical protein
MVVGMETFDIDALPVDWEALTSAGRAMTEAADRQRWQLGDLANKVTRVYGSESLKTFAGEINIPNHKTLWDYSRVAARFEKSVRNEFPALSFTHFRTAIRAKDDAELFLVQAQDNGWPVAELARQIAAAIGRPVPPVLLYSGRGRILEDTQAWRVVEGMRTWMALLTGPIETELTDGLIVTIKVYAEAE